MSLLTASDTECPLCGDPLVLEARLLPCLHSVCHDCLVDIVNEKNQRRIQCRICSEPFDQENVLVNFAIQTAAEAQLSSTGTNRYSWLNRKQELKLQQQQARKDERMCLTHPNNFASAFCDACRRIVCQDCATAHKGHSFVPIEEARINFTHMVQADKKQLQHRITTLDSSLADVAVVFGRLSSRLECMIFDINTTFVNLARQKADLATQLDQRRSRLIAIAKQEFQETVKTVQLQRDSVEFVKQLHLTAMKQLHMLGADQLTPLPALLRLHNAVSTRLRLLARSELPVTTKIKDCIHFSFPRGDPWSIPIDRLGHVGRGRLYAQLTIPEMILKSKWSYTISLSTLPDGNIVATSFRKPSLQIYSPIGMPVRKMRVASQPYCTVASKHEIWVAESERSRLAAYSYDGKPLKYIACRHVAAMALLADGNVIVVSMGETVQALFTSDGTELWTCEGEFHGAAGVAVLEDATELVVCDSENHRLAIVNSINGCIKRFIASGQLQTPLGIAVTSEGLLVVTESTGHCVSIWTVTGTLVHRFGSLGSRPGQFNDPRSVTVLQDGRFAVADSDNRRVLLF